jgi:hypothetical protein
MAKMINEGINAAMGVILKGETAPDLYMGLYTDPTSEPAANQTLADLTEPAAGNYARIAIDPNDWTISAQIATNVMKTFQASGGNFGSCYGCFITDCANGTSGNLWAVEHFASPANLTDGQAKVIIPGFTGS